MDNGPPDSKRLRTGGPVPGPPQSWNNASRDPTRNLPHPTTPSATQYPQHGPPYPRQPDPQPNPLDLHRRHSAHSDQRLFDQDSRRPSSGPSPHTFHQSTTQPQPPTQLPPYGGQQDVMMKREPVEDVQYRPASTGSATDHIITSTHAEARYPPQLPPFELPQHARSQPYQAGPAYIPQSPMQINEPYGQSAYGTPGLPPPRQDYAAYATPLATTQKRKAQRAAQACDSCRNLKAKCDEGRPLCTTCKERGFTCVYRDPPPKQYVSYSSEQAQRLIGAGKIKPQPRLWKLSTS